MMRALAVLFVLLSGCTRSYEPEPAETTPVVTAPAEKRSPAAESARLPFDPFAGAIEGDWALYAVRSATRVNDRLARAERANVLFELLADPDEVCLKVLEQHRGMDLDEPHLEAGARSGSGQKALGAPRGAAPRVSEYLALLGPLHGASAGFTAPLVVDEVYVTSQGRAITDRDHRHACKRVTFRVVDDAGASDVTLWLDPAVRGLGLVAMRCETTAGPRTTELDLEVWGYGGRAGEEFGWPKELVFKSQ